jgi:hypothetical protein
MFYTPYMAYDFLPSAAQADEARRRGCAVYIFEGGVAKPLGANAE